MGARIQHDVRRQLLVLGEQSVHPTVFSWISKRLFVLDRCVGVRARWAFCILSKTRVVSLIVKDRPNLRSIRYTYYRFTRRHRVNKPLNGEPSTFFHSKYLTKKLLATSSVVLDASSKYPGRR